MPLSTTFRRHYLPRKIVYASVAAGLTLSVLFILITLVLIAQRRHEQHDRLASDAQTYILNDFNTLTQRLSPLDALTYDDCASGKDDLTQRAAFAGNIRTILLVKDHVAFCSSATGRVQKDITLFSPHTDTRKAVDIQLVTNTPKVPERPALIFWRQNLQNPQRGIIALLNINLTPFLLLIASKKEVTNMAIVAGGQALTLTDERLTKVSALPAHPLRTITVPGFPVTILLYGTALPASDVLIVVLLGMLLALPGGSTCFLLLTHRRRPGKEILQGIRRGDFHVEYQPLIDATSGQPYGVEALLRWRHPTAGNVSPEAFIRYAEGQNLIVPLTRHLFELVARDAHQLRHTLPEGFRIGLNLSPVHLADGEFCQDVRRWLAAMPQNHFCYVFEITERAMVSEDNAGPIFTWLQNQGIHIAIDDFGTGHSALIYLEKFKFDCLKIDRGFVQSIGRETVTSPVLDAVIALAKKLKLKTIAEGVEDEKQAQWLIARGVTHLQGYLFSHPLTVPQLIAYFNSADRPGLPGQRKEA
ncbi:cyclic di-GMP phosphodiesterase [Pantoea sp. FN060301]|uniref:cyclic di-GMP phosphodiesterase n=1 Tax=Pantoea sp. FN060301 TaxID=3420380 RepID=UPI003D178BFE